MKHKLAILSLVLLVGLSFSLPAFAVVVFQVSSNIRSIRQEGTTEAVGTVVLAAITNGNIGAGSSIGLDYGTKLITTGTVTCSAAVCDAPANFILTTDESVLMVTFVTTVAFQAGDTLIITGARIDANAFGVGTITADLSGKSPGLFPFTFSSTSVPVADVRPQATTVEINPTGPILTEVQSFSISVAENFSQALTSATDEAGLGPAPSGGITVDSVVELTFSDVPVGVTISLVDFADSSSTLTPTTMFTDFTADSGSQTTVVDIAITATSTTANETLVVNFTASAPDAVIPPGLFLGSVTVTLAGGTAPDVPTFADNTQGAVRVSGPTPSPLVIISGNGQIGTVGTELPQPLIVKVQDENGNPVAEETVTFAATRGGGVVSEASATTDAQGMAQTRATLGPEPGTHKFTATLNPRTVRTFFASARPIQIPPFPFTRVVPHIVAGGGFLTQIAIVNLAEEENPIQINILSQAGDIVRNETNILQPSGRVDVSTGEARRFAELTIEWAIVGSELPVGVSVFFDVRLPGSETPGTAAGVSATKSLRTIRLPFAFAQAGQAQTAPLTLGLALSNLSGNPSVIDLDLLNVMGEVLVQDSFTLAPFGQSAFVLAERPAFDAFLRDQHLFFGSVAIKASEPISVIGVGSESGQFFAVPHFSQAVSCFLAPLFPPQPTIIPHIAEGGGWAAQISITNLCGAENPVRIEVFDQAGTLVESFLGSDTILLPRGTAVFSSPEGERFDAFPAGPRWARLTSNLPIGVHVLLDFKSASSEASTSAVGASESPPSTHFALPVAFAPSAAGQSASLTMGLALANVSDSTNDIVLKLVDPLGRVVAEESSISLPPQGQAAVLVSDLPAFNAFLNSQPEFSGTLFVIASQPVSPLGVGFFGSAFAIPAFAIPNGGQ
ncbi:MAG: Ig-like domain-containing protein [Acidobacteria bacterium]|nr:Ig-like domain-containing protein [Acidobacteriota bacterium]